MIRHAFGQFQYPTAPLQVSLKRKSAAVAALSAHVVDRLGHPAPSSPGTYELRSVAVPYGGCTEPSNVKAGGEACPIRFQCAGCGYYRPDPSYLPAIEQHINELRADRETAQAMDAAEFVTTALTAQITAFEHVCDFRVRSWCGGVGLSWGIGGFLITERVLPGR